MRGLNERGALAGAFLLVAALSACGSSGRAPGATETSGFSVPDSGAGSGTTPDGGLRVLGQDGGAVDAGVPPAGGTTDAGLPPLPPHDGGLVYGGCGEVDLSGTWRGTFRGEVWILLAPWNREPVAGQMVFTLTCYGQKFQVEGTMTGSELHLANFTARISGEVTPGPDPVLNAIVQGEITFPGGTNTVIPFRGTATGPIVDTRVDDGTFEGASTDPQIPGAGEGTWEAARQ